MELFLEILKTILIGIVQGITEWLPVSSTGHMILVEELVSFSASDAFVEMFRVVIQFGSILAVVVLYFGRLNPFVSRKRAMDADTASLTLGGKTLLTARKSSLSLWGKIAVAAIPAGVIGILLDDILDTFLYNYITVAITLIAYGIAFIVIERVKKNSTPRYACAEDISYGTALKIGCFQVLSLIPGTSRSGSTILGGMLTGVSRPAGAEFSFFLAIPVMLGASCLKILKYVLEVGFSFTASELLILAVGVAVAFAVSLVALRFLVSFVRRHSFAVFGYYRIALGAVVLLTYFLTR